MENSDRKTFPGKKSCKFDQIRVVGRVALLDAKAIIREMCVTVGRPPGQGSHVHHLFPFLAQSSEVEL